MLIYLLIVFIYLLGSIVATFLGAFIDIKCKFGGYPTWYSVFSWAMVIMQILILLWYYLFNKLYSIFYNTLYKE